jgi:hypothetical protein
MLERIIYVSRAAPGVALADVFGIIRDSVPRNRADGVSGALVFLDGWFAQVLEGQGPALGAAWTRIARDPRHAALSFRTRERALCRLFGDRGLLLRTGPTLDPAVLREFDYHAGFPAADFPADVLLEFMVWACRRPPVAARETATPETATPETAAPETAAPDHGEAHGPGRRAAGMADGRGRSR